MIKRITRIISLFMALIILCSLPIYVCAANQKMSLQWQRGKRVVEVGKKIRLKVKIRHKKRGSRLVWSSSSKKIATVSKRGVVSGKRAGKVTISVKIPGAALKRSCRIRVVKPAIPGGKPEASRGTSRPGNPAQITASPGVDLNAPKETGLPEIHSSAEPADPGGNQSKPTGNPSEIPVLPTINPAETPVIPTENPLDPTGNPIAPTAAPTVSVVPTVSPAPIYVPDDTELIPYSAVMEIQGEVMTVYLVHKNYNGQVHVRLNGKEFTAGGNAKDALMLLAYGGTTKTDSSGRIQVSRRTQQDGNLEEYWTVADLEQGMNYQMKAETRNTIYPAISGCGVIYFRGDVTEAIEIY